MFLLRTQKKEVLFVFLVCSVVSNEASFYSIMVLLHFLVVFIDFDVVVGCWFLVVGYWMCVCGYGCVLFWSCLCVR